MKDCKKIIATTLAILCVMGISSYGTTQLDVLNNVSISADETTNAKAQELLNLVNSYRQENGLKPFKTCNVMNTMASVRATEITDNVYLNRPDGSYYGTIFKSYNINTTTFNQNTYWGGIGYDTPQKALENFKNNTRQNSNLLSTAYEYIGIGVYIKDNKTYYYQLFCTSSDLKEDIQTTTTTIETTTPITTTTTLVDTSNTTTTTPVDTSTTTTTPVDTSNVTTITTTDTTTETTTITTTNITTLETTPIITSESLSNEQILMKYNLDVNKDNEINTVDLVILKKYLLGILYS